LDFGVINPAVVKAFDEKAFDGVPFVMSMPDNKHPKKGEEPDQLEGDLERLELGQDGSLYGYFDLSQSQRVRDIIRKSNGKFGVSGRIEVDYTAGDTGKSWPYALRHVCGTTSPHLKGMAGWQPVDLTEEEKAQETIDFSGEVIEDKKKEVKDDDKENGGDLMSKLTDEQITRLLALVDDLDAIGKSADDIEKEEDREKPAELPKEVKDQIAASEAASKKALELAERMQVSAASERWEAQRAILLTEGVPPVILDLAGKVLSRHRTITLDFAEDDTVDATQVVRDILNECKGVITLGDERGHQFTGDHDTPENKAYKELEENFNAMWAHDGRDL
jgi:hypothetical protein